MDLLLGLFLWSVVHFIPSMAQPIKKGWINLMGENGYKATFSLLIALSLVLIVYGWRHTIPSHIYSPVVSKPIVILLMVVAFILFGASKPPAVLTVGYATLSYLAWCYGLLPIYWQTGIAVQ